MDVIYVSGFGRSGSSVVDAILASHTGSLEAGELCHLYLWASEGRACSCGLPVGSCGWWGPVIDQVVDQLGQDVATLASASEVAERGGPDAAWREIWQATFDALGAVHSCSRVVDSSKTAGDRQRLRLLGSLPRTEVRLNVHLVRALGGVMFSFRKGGNRQLESGDMAPLRLAELRALKGWWEANRSATRQASAAQRTISLRYEALVDPEPLLRTLAEAQLVGAEPAVLGHAIAGNRVRREATDLTFRPDLAWRSRLPAHWRVLAAAGEHASTLTRMSARQPRPEGSRARH